MVFEAYAASNPWTMVVHAHDADTTCTAVVSSRRLWLIALVTISIRNIILELRKSFIFSIVFIE